MKLNNIDSIRDKKCIDKSGREIQCSSARYEWFMKHSWVIYRNPAKQKDQIAYNMSIHYYVFCEIAPNEFKRLYGATCIGGGTKASTFSEDSSEEKVSDKRKWTFHFYEAWRKGANKIRSVTMMVYEKTAVKEVLPYLGIVVLKSGFYSPQFCMVAHDKVVVKPHFNLPSFRCDISRHEHEERMLCATFQLLFDMKRCHRDVFESVVQNGVKERFPALGFLFRVFYPYSFDREERELPSAHVFPQNDFLDEASLKFFYKILNKGEAHPHLPEVIETVNKYLSAWRVQGAYRQGKVQDAVIPHEQCKLAKQAYPYLSIQPITVTMTLREAFDHWFDLTPGYEKWGNFDSKKAREYTQSVDKIVYGFPQQIECLPIHPATAPKYISHFKELIHCFWFMSNHFALTGSDRLYHDKEGQLFKNLSEEVQGKLNSITVTFIYRCKEQNPIQL